MPALETSCRNQKVVYWAKSGMDKFSKVTVSGRVELDARFEKKSGETMNAKNERVATIGTMISDQDLLIGSIIWIGSIDAWETATTPTDYMVIVGVDKIPDLKGRNFYREITLSNYNDTLPSLT